MIGKNSKKRNYFSIRIILPSVCERSLLKSLKISVILTLSAASEAGAWSLYVTEFRGFCLGTSASNKGESKIFNQMLFSKIFGSAQINFLTK